MRDVSERLVTGGEFSQYLPCQLHHGEGLPQREFYQPGSYPGESRGKRMEAIVEGHRQVGQAVEGGVGKVGGE